MQENTQRNLELIKDKEAGMTYRELEKKYNISPNTITRIVYRYRVKKALEEKEDL